MTPKATLWIFAYDLGDPRERRLVARLLEGYGMRVQRSVFECLLTHTQQRAIWRALEQLHLRSGYLQAWRELLPRQRRQAGACLPEPFTEDQQVWIIESPRPSLAAQSTVSDEGPTTS